MPQKIKALFNARTTAILGLGFSSGLPLALSGGTLQAWFAENNLSIIAIGFLSLIGQPYIYKFLWASVLDRFVPPLLGRRRGWIMLMQVALALTLIFMGLGQPHSHPIYLASLAFLLAFFSATQDMSIDAYRTDLLTRQEWGLGAGFYITGYRVALIFSGGLALIMAGQYGFRVTYFVMAGLMLILTNITYFSPEPKNITAPHSFKEIFKQSLLNIIQKPQFKLIVLFLILYKLGDAFTVSLVTAFLIKSLHFSLETIGLLNKIWGTVASILGGIIGGIILSRLNLFRALLYFGLLQALCSFLFMALAIVGKNIFLLGLTIFTDNFFSGMSAAALIVFITGLCHKKFSATQFSFFSAIASLSRVFIGPFAGISAQFMSWEYFFCLSFFLSLPGLSLLWVLKNSYYKNLILNNIK